MPKKKSEGAAVEIPAINWDDPGLYFNRELSFLQLNLRVLEEALDERHPLLERVKFLAIFSSNLDEFFMIRVSGLYRQWIAGVTETPPDGMTPAEQLAAIRREILPPLTTQMNCWQNDLLPKLAAEGIRVLGYADLKGKQRKLLRRYFEQEIFPVLTPLAFDPGHPFPHISNLSINLAVVVRDPLHGERFARLKIPDVFPRLLRIPAEEKADNYDPLGLKTVVDNNFVWIEEVVAANLDMLFPGVEVVAAYPFRVTRDADLEIEEDEASDLLETIAEGIERRQFGSVVRLEVDKHMPKNIRDILSSNLEIPPYLVYTADGPIGLADVMGLMLVDRPDLKDTPFVPYTPRAFSGEESIFTAIRRKQHILLYHPYDSFAPVVNFLEEAARDPQVLAIKQTLYRVGTNAPVVDALLKARENGKQVAVLVELKARFDEENNITWARALERAGVHVIYGLVGLKTHAKVCMVVRREPDGMKRYVHLATGNYNAVTARIYTDLGYFTVDPDIGADVADLFNTLTGYARVDSYRKLLVAPKGIRTGIISRIEREIEVHKRTGNGYLAFKMNQLVDKECIVALYRASQAGVKVDLQVRGICCLRPGIPGVSENIRVTSIVGRFLEHTRIFYFHNGGDEEILLGSADLMPRNLDRRVETLFPIEAPELRTAIRDHILRIHLRDNVQARLLTPEGVYKRIHAKPGEEEINSQLWMLSHRGIWHVGE
ncbi:MAG TPA: polyphosphate kinase 1 [Anaerolineae bacterium]|nr:polyphosphate kinase 1 [Anaerolineae bacterium]HQK14769.1 polyphosphate kinase 1 [Anaerolineae bacterium]